MTSAVTQDALSPEVMAALSATPGPRFLATRDADGVPNVVPVLSLQAADERTIVFAELMIWKTRRNLDADPRVSILVLSEDLRAWTVKARFREFQRSGPYFDAFMESPAFRYNPYSGIRSAGVIDVLEASPALSFSRAGVLADAIRARWLAGRLSKNGRSAGVMPRQVHEKFARLKAAKAVAFLDAGGHPRCLPGLPLLPAGPSTLVWRSDQGGPEPGARVAAAAITPEPVAYQVKGQLAGRHRAFGRDFAAISLAESYSASPPLPGERLFPRA